MLYLNNLIIIVRDFETCMWELSGGAYAGDACRCADS